MRKKPTPSKDFSWTFFMPTNISGRVTLILLVLAAAFILIFPPGKIADSSIPWSQKHDLRPGIDMVGGTSLLYEIKTPPGAQYNPNLANEVMTSLKKRVDPDGVRNLIWRPQGATRLEIQMPLSARTGSSKQIREEYATAQRALEATNLRHADVSAAIETLTGAARDKRIDELAMGSEQRRTLLTQMAGRGRTRTRRSRRSRKINMTRCGWS
jgi:SecD/SecF fusion protein